MSAWNSPSGDASSVAAKANGGSSSAPSGDSTSCEAGVVEPPIPDFSSTLFPYQDADAVAGRSAITIREGEGLEEEELNAPTTSSLLLQPASSVESTTTKPSALSIKLQQQKDAEAHAPSQPEQVSPIDGDDAVSATQPQFGTTPPLPSVSSSSPSPGSHHPASPSPSAATTAGETSLYSEDFYDYCHDDRASTSTTRSPPGSPSSLSSWNSYVGGRRGDLADVEDLELEESHNKASSAPSATQWHHYHYHGHGHGYHHHGEPAALHEPELETVSEREEDSLYSESAEQTEDSDADPVAPVVGKRKDGVRHFTGLHLSDHKQVSKKSHQQRHDEQSPPPESSGSSSPAHTPLPHGGSTTTSHSHFSTRGLGHVHAQHGLRWPARRRKGRVAEIVEEGQPEGPVTVIPSPTMGLITPDVSSSSPSSGTTSPVNENFAVAQASAASTASAAVHAVQAAQAAHTHSHASLHDWASATDYITGPPALPPRSVSPSETIPAIPSRLCECVNAGEEEEEDLLAGDGTIKASKREAEGSARDIFSAAVQRSQSVESNKTDQTAMLRERSADSITSSTLSLPAKDFEDPTTPTAERPPNARDAPSGTASTSSCSCISVTSSSHASLTATEDGAETDATAPSTPPTSPPHSPVSRHSTLTRKGSSKKASGAAASTDPVATPTTEQGRPRRFSTSATLKKPLRPCFRRRSSAKTPSTARNRESSSEREPHRCSQGDDARLRATAPAADLHPHVRFSLAPPEEVRTHSPVDYDRRSCGISSHLSTGDVEELRLMKMELGLLEAKWAAMNAVKKADSRENGTWGAGYRADHSVEISFGHTPNHNPVLARARQRADVSRRLVDNRPPPLGSSPSSATSDLPPYTSSHSPASSPSHLSTTQVNPFFRPASPKLRPPGSPGAMSETSELLRLDELDRERAMLGGNHCPARLGRKAHAERVCLMSRFGLLDAPPPPLPGTLAKSGYMSTSSIPTFGGNASGYKGNQRLSYSQYDLTNIPSSPVTPRPTSPVGTRSSSGTQRSSSAPPVSRTDSEERLKARPPPAAAPSREETEEATPRGRSTANKPVGASASAIPAVVQTSPSPPRAPSPIAGKMTLRAVPSSSSLASSASSSSISPQPTPKMTAGYESPLRSPIQPSSPSSPMRKLPTFSPQKRPMSFTPRAAIESARSSPATSSFPNLAACGSGYDSPASEFYESGSEYDLLG